MKRYFGTAALAAAIVAGGLAFAAPALAVPPTVSPSPGYDARLHEKNASPSRQEFVRPGTRYRHHRHVKRFR